MVNLIIGCIGLIGLCTAFIAGLSWWNWREFDQWVAQQGAKEHEMRLEPVFMGNEVVGYTVVTTNRSKAL